MLQMLARHCVIFKKDFKDSRLSVCRLYNSESGPKILEFLDNSNHQIV